MQYVQNLMSCRPTCRSSSITSSMVITPITSSLDGNSGIGEFSMSRMHSERFGRFFTKGAVEDRLVHCWSPSFCNPAEWEWLNFNFIPVIWSDLVRPRLQLSRRRKAKNKIYSKAQLCTLRCDDLSWIHDNP